MFSIYKDLYTYVRTYVVKIAVTQNLSMFYWEYNSEGHYFTKLFHLGIKIY